MHDNQMSVHLSGIKQGVGLARCDDAQLSREPYGSAPCSAPWISGIAGSFLDRLYVERGDSSVCSTWSSARRGGNSGLSLSPASPSKFTSSCCISLSVTGVWLFLGTVACRLRAQRLGSLALANTTGAGMAQGNAKQSPAGLQPKRARTQKLPANMKVAPDAGRPRASAHARQLPLAA